MTRIPLSYGTMSRLEQLTIVIAFGLIIYGLYVTCAAITN